MVPTNHASRIDVRGLTKRFGTLTAVEGLSFTVEPGSVTGFLGPNGSGKTTTLRMLLGLVTPDGGTATIGGRAYRALHAPPATVGAVLEASGFHPARSGRNHLRTFCAANGYPSARADEVLELVGLAGAGRRTVKGYSLGMRQRLALATGLLGDPPVLVLDEPSNGLDPEGIAWMRSLLRDFAGQGRTVLVSSHVLSEVQQLVDRAIVINRGRLVREGTLSDLTDGHHPVVSVHTPQADDLTVALAPASTDGARVERTAPDRLRVSGIDAAAIGRLAHTGHIELHGLATEASDLETAFFALTTPASPEPGPALEEVG